MFYGIREFRNQYLASKKSGSLTETHGGYPAQGAREGRAFRIHYLELHAAAMNIGGGEEAGWGDV